MHRHYRGFLKIAEVASRFENVRSFITALANLGFKMLSKVRQQTVIVQQYGNLYLSWFIIFIMLTKLRHAVTAVTAWCADMRKWWHEEAMKQKVTAACRYLYFILFFSCAILKIQHLPILYMIIWFLQVKKSGQSEQKWNNTKASGLPHLTSDWLILNENLVLCFSTGHREHSLLLLWVSEDWRCSREHKEIWTAAEAVSLQEKMNFSEGTSVIPRLCLFPAWVFWFQSNSCTVLYKFLVDDYIFKPLFLSDFSWSNIRLWSGTTTIQINAGLL